MTVSWKGVGWREALEEDRLGERRTGEPRVEGSWAGCEGGSRLRQEKVDTRDE